MTRRLTLRAEAERDIEQAWSWYHDISPEIGRAFLIDLIELLDHVGEFPTMYQIVHRTARRAVFHSFPYSVFYRVLPATVEVIGILHSHVDPRQVWKRATTAVGQ